MGASTMSEEPIKAGEFNRALDSIRESASNSSKALSEAMEKGFASIDASLLNVRAEIISFRSFQMDQAEKNGAFTEQHRQHRDALSGAKKILHDEVEEVKDKQGKTHTLALSALVSLILGLIAVLTDLIMRLRGAR